MSLRWIVIRLKMRSFDGATLIWKSPFDWIRVAVMPFEARSPRLAVLIDADNTSAKIADGLFEEIAKIGEASVRRIYGDFSSARSKRLTENELSDFSRLWHDGCGKAIIEIQDVDRNHSPEI